MKQAVAAVLVAAALATPARAQWQEPFEPEGYRTDNYRAPVPATLDGARVLSTADAEAIWRDRRGVFIDVTPRAPKPKNLPPATVWRDPPRFDIPGSVWLPDTGYGALPTAMEQYYRDGLERASRGNKAALLVIYCLADCWMSWNAAKRALTYGYVNVAWYPDGTDGWLKAKLNTVEAQPEPRPDQAE
jgi:PQQ-dependent catabolism-associated CXXCW motif protein